MNNKFLLSNIIRFVLLIALQVLLLNELPLNRAYLMIYPLIILLLPVFTPRLAVLFIAFFTGMIIDVFSNGGGLHTAALTAVGYLRSYILDTFQPRSGWDKLDVPNISQQGLTWFFYYSLIFFSIHHWLYFFLEVFSFTNFFATIFKTMISLFGSLLLMWILTLFFMRNSRE
ncbi:MAG: rod shape-determining protein MreD [Bacteroidota bacterium]|nr:rod shape-determining protein MreD [Bacteroidota bacterium]